QFSDVQPTDWAFQALQSLVERYGCIAGYPNSTFRGNRALTRFEFAAGLNACLDRMNELIAIAVEQVVPKDLETLKRLQEEYGAELATLRGRVDALEFRAAELESNQFSTTAKLKGEAIFAVSGAFGDTKADADGNTATSPNADLDDNTIFSNRVRIGFDSSFTGKDKLRVRLQARNTPSLRGATGTNMARLGFDGDNGNDVELEELNYAFMPFKGAKVKIDANAGESNDNINVFNPLFKSSGGGSISRYGRFSPIYRVAKGNFGATVTLGGKKSPIKANVAYFSDSNNNPTSGNGLFSNDSAYLGQLEFKPMKNLNLGLTYVRGYRYNGDDLTEDTGSSLANSPFSGQPTVSNNYGVQASLKLSKKMILSGWYGLTDAQVENGGQSNESADIEYWAASLGFKDFGAKGNTLGVIFGQSPKVTDVNNSMTVTPDQDTSYHLEGLYKMKLNENIAVTPGLLVIFNPEHNDNNDTVYVGTLRTTFKF
ncbi:MAG: iron uptake porin, partial [Cyanobacteria bacterium J06641_2]